MGQRAAVLAARIGAADVTRVPPTPSTRSPRRCVSWRRTMARRLFAHNRPSLRSEHLYAGSLNDRAVHRTVDPCQTIGEDERGNAERRAMFVGLWPPMFWLIGDTIRRREEQLERPRGIRSACARHRRLHPASGRLAAAHASSVRSHDRSRRERLARPRTAPHEADPPRPGAQQFRTPVRHRTPGVENRTSDACP